MGGYVVNFTVYTMAMAGLICFAVFVYKKVMDGSFRGDGSKYLAVEESMNLTPRKTLHIVRAGSEKFLIASDVDRTTLISKLGQETQAIQNTSFAQLMPEPVEIPQEQPRQKVRLEPVKVKNPEVSHIRKGMDRREAYNKTPVKTVELDFDTPVNHGFSTMKEMAKKINEL